MIKANELRIGNYVYVTETNDNDILQLSKKLFESLIIFDTFDRLLPIPLTEEWLKDKYIATIIKEGIWNRIECRLSEQDILPYFVLHYSTTKKVYYFAINDTIITTGFDGVHKLQNVFYAFKGKELTINK